MRKLFNKQKNKADSITYEGNNPPETGQDMLSYKNMMLTQEKWAQAGSGCKMVVGWAIVSLGCVGACMLVTILDRGWDGLLVLMGWK